MQKFFFFFKHESVLKKREGSLFFFKFCSCEKKFQSISDASQWNVVSDRKMYSSVNQKTAHTNISVGLFGCISFSLFVFSWPNVYK